MRVCVYVEKHPVRSVLQVAVPACMLMALHCISKAKKCLSPCADSLNITEADAS